MHCEPRTLLIKPRAVDHGSTEGLKNIWMPLDAFVKETMEKLRRGGPQIPIGSAARRWDRFEKGKLEAIIY